MTENEAAAGSLYRTVFDVLGEGVMVWGSDGRVLECNAAAAAIVGRPRDDLIQLDFDGVMRLGNLAPTAVRADGSAYGTEELPAVIVRRTGDAIRNRVVGFERPDGRFVWVETDLQPVSTGAGPPSGVVPHAERASASEPGACSTPPILVVSFRDITARRERQEELRFQAQLLSAVAQSVVAVDTAGTVLYCNDTAARMFGLDPATAVGRPIATLMRASHSAEEGREVLARLRAGDVWSGDTTIVTRHGAAVPIFVINSPIVDDDGRLVGVISVSTDITERTRAEARMRTLSAIVDWSADAIIGYQPDGRISVWNRGAERLFGYSATEVIGLHVTRLIPEDRRIEFERVLTRVRTGLAVDRLVTFREHKSGELLEVSLTISPVLDGDGRVVALSSIVRDVTEVMDARRSVERSEALFRALFQYSSDVAFILTPRGTVRWVSPAVASLGYDPGDLVGRRALDAVHPEDRAAGRTTIAHAMRAGEPAVLEWRVRAGDGEWRWVEAVLTDLTQVESIGGVVANVRDITDRRVAESRRLEAEVRFREGFDKAAVGLALLDLDFRATSVNAAMCRLLGESDESLLGRHATEFLHPLDVEWVRADFEHLARGSEDHLEHEFRIMRADGDAIWAIVDVALVRDADGDPSYFFLQLRDITDRKRAEAALEHRALHDELTELPNRLLLADRLKQSLARAVRTRSKVAVLFADVDRFKVINDGLGHSVGDDMLVEVARRIESVLAPSDTIARFGGDEFVIVCEDVTDAADAASTAHRVLEAFDAPLSVGGRLRYATLSIGVALAEPGASAGQILRDADTAMYRAKELGRARVEMFSEALQREVATRLDFETELRGGAIERNELSLLYQPIVELSDGHIVGVEALLRWHHRRRGLVAPTEFIPVAEETGMIVPIGTWALSRAMRDLAGLRARSDNARALFVSVNLSALQLRLHDVVRTVDLSMREAGIPPSALQLELTESALTTDDDMATALEQMKHLGVQIAVDDFGTGYSSLNRLKRLPIDALKIDRSFVDGLPADPHDQSITKAVVALGRTLGLTIVAEGVETVEQWIALDEIGCQFGQGFFWSEPVPIDDLVELLAEDTRLATGTD